MRESADDVEAPVKSHRILIFIMFAGTLALLLWSANTTLTGVTRSTGMVVPFTQNQIIQHLEGGIVSEINVKEGDKVEKGQTLLRIEDTLARSNLEQTLTTLNAKRAAVARLDAEISDKPTISFPADLPPGTLVQNEVDLFNQKRQELDEELLLFEDKINQQKIALGGLRRRLENQLKERQIAEERLQGIQNLLGMGAASKTELLQAMSAFQESQTKIDDLNHDIPQTEAALSEAVRQRTSAVLKFRTEAAQEKNKTLTEIAQLQDAVQGMQERAARTEVKAPVSGIVNNMMISTVGGVISPGSPILELVPTSDVIAIEAQLSPEDRAQIWPGTKAIVKITAYDYSVYGALNAEVIDISPDVVKDKEKEAYFRVRLNAPNVLGEKHPVIPGMMANVDMMTRQYTVLDYLLSPVINAADLALRQ
jgi:HlyD family type I secretion membrane fusion protein